MSYLLFALFVLGTFLALIFLMGGIVWLQNTKNPRVRKHQDFFIDVLITNCCFILLISFLCGVAFYLWGDSQEILSLFR